MNTIRNFSIIAHIDHGKTTLTDQLLLQTGSISQRQFHERLLDSNPIEQERGITIKLAPVHLHYRPPHPIFNSSFFTLNLIDTPGHVDFAYEVSRSLSACEGAVLLVDATKGIQAQTIANFDQARQHHLTIIPVINKIDLPNAEPDKVAQERDSQRVNDLNALITAAEKYKDEYGFYPITTTVEKTNQSTLLRNALVPDFIDSLPQDPLDPQYWYGYNSDGYTVTVTSIVESNQTDAIVGENVRYQQISK